MLNLLHLHLNSKKLILPFLLRDYTTVIIWGIITGSKNEEGERRREGRPSITTKLHHGKP